MPYSGSASQFANAARAAAVAVGVVWGASKLTVLKLTTPKGGSGH
jgi:hypothetical protein